MTATVVAIVLVAMGIGFAYTASTQNTGNVAGNEYVTLVQGGEGAYMFASDINVRWNTADGMVGSKPTTVFTTEQAMSRGTDEHMTDCYLLQLGEPFTIVAEGIGTTSTLEVDIGCPGQWYIFEGGDHPTTYFLKVENSTTTWFKWAVIHHYAFYKYGTDGWNGGTTFNIDYDAEHGRYYDTTVTVYYAIDGGDSIAVEHEPGESPAGPNQPDNHLLLAGAHLIFKVTRT